MDRVSLSLRSGYTLIEALVSMVLVGLMTLGGMSFYRNAARFQQVAMHKQMAVEIANSKLEDIRRAGYPSLPDPASATVMETGNINIGTPPAYFEHFGSNILNRTVTVDDVLNGLGGTEYKKVTVLVSWTEVGAGNARSIELTSYVTP